MFNQDIYKIIVGSISAIALIVTLGVVGLSISERKIPPELSGLGIGAIASLSGILSPSPLQSKRGDL
jgi:hypothetical protein